MEEAVKNAEAAEERLRNALREKERVTTQLLSLRRNAAKLFRSVQEVCTCLFFALVLNFGCLPFTWANRLVHCLGKWYAKFRTGKLRPGIAFTICTNQFHLPKNDSEGLNLVTYVFKEVEHEFPFGIFRPEKQDNLFRNSVALGKFLPKRPKTIFRKLFLKGKQPLLPLRVVGLFITIFLFTILLGSKRV